MLWLSEALDEQVQAIGNRTAVVPLAAFFLVVRNLMGWLTVGAASDLTGRV